MQNATIQINAMSGMGDIFCDIYIAVIIANAFKKEDCNTDLKFYWGPHPVDNKKIFDDSFFDNFNSVETIDKPITESNYGDQKHIGFSGKAGITSKLILLKLLILYSKRRLELTKPFS